MKRIFTLLVLTIFFGLSASAQKSYVNYNKDSRWFFGINGGATWHSRTEVDNVIKGGYGFTFGRSFGMKPEKLFSWDLRLRYLHGFWGGQATTPYLLDSTSASNLPATYPSATIQTYQDSTGSFIPNFKTQLLSGSLELALNTNRLRENTGWNIQIFGGIGVKGYNSRADLTNTAGDIYDYTGVGNNKPAILAAQDGTYESYITGSDGDLNVDWMGSFGAGISYQVTPWASIGISHKMTWTRTNDEFDLMPNDVSGISTGKNDIYHYSSAGIKFHLFGGNHTPIDDPIVEDTTDIDQFDLVDDPVVTPPPVQKPIVDIYDPGVSPYTVETDHFNLKAYVHHVHGKQNITFKQDGNVNNNFSYSPDSDKFSSNVLLHPGQNIFEITGWNDAGQDYESTIIVYKKEEPSIEPPIVTITNPPYTPYTVYNSTFNFSGTVLNVDSKSQIKVYFNGAYMSNFTYSTSSKALYATLNLQEGTNTVTVTATNPAGSDSKTVKIIYERPQQVQPPIVDFIVPATDPHTTSHQQFNVTASVLNVDDKNNIIVEVNGHPTSNFNFNTVTKKVTFGISLLEGANVVQITGSNSAGVDQEHTTIIYKRPEAPKPPIVTFIDPALDPLTVYSPSYNVKAKVLNVNSASDITLKINGVQSYNFSYSTSSKMMHFTTNLLLGSNVIEITGTNNVGSDLETTTIIYKRVVPQAPPIVNITYPAIDNQEFNTPNITVSATVLNVSSAANITVLVNGNPTSAFLYNTATKILTLPITMVPGANTIKVTGTNTAGSDFDTRIIIYKRSIVPAPPTVDFTNPPSSPHLVNTDVYQVTATTSNIDSKSQISLMHNGNLINDNQYVFTSNHQIVFNAQLIQGSNIFDVQVTNDDGTAQDMAIVTYKVDNQPCIIPTVGYISPVPYSTVTDPNVNIDAQINNHSQETVVELLLNGVSKGFMAYNSNTSIASLPVSLNEGSNAITVIATNNCGSNQATFTLNYVAPEAPCYDPTVTANGVTNLTTQDEKVSVQAGISEITGANSITVTVNGQSAPFTYDVGTQTVSANDVPLSIGNNAIIITATNDCGAASITYHVLRKECYLPTISNPSHTSGLTTEAYNIPFSVTVSNAIGSQIELIINNISQPFTFNTQSGVLSSAVNLSEGVNTIVVNATNSCGTASETYTFTHKTPCNEITYSLLTPANLVSTVTQPEYAVLLHVNGTIDAGGIATTLNGAPVPNTFDPIASNVSITGITLVDGENIIELILTNDCSEKRVALTVNYNGCQPPVITFPSVGDGAIFSTSNIDLDAVVTNSNGAGNISLLVNGNATSFNFNDQNNTLSAALDLVVGPNVIKLSVAGCEPASKTITVIYEVPCTPISYTLMQPATNNVLVVDEAFQLSMNLVGIENMQQIVVKVNDHNHPFTYDAGTQILTVNGITLTDGENGIVVEANNDCSSETIVYDIEYNGCQPPVITLGSNPNVASTALYDYSVFVTNIANASEIVVLHNGAPQNFVFDANAGTVTGEVQLTEGQNAFVITANGCETDSKQFEVTYTIPCDPIVFSLATPSTTETSVADENYSVSLVAQYADAGTISVTLNGAPIAHTYANDIITTSNMTLIDGDNVIVVSMANECSSETVTYTVHHDGCDAPVINISGNADAVTDATYNLSAHLANITNQNEITLTVNGTNVAFTYDLVSGELNAILQLNEGANAIVIAANACAAATESFNVTYTVPCDPVTYSLGSPAQLSSVVDGETTSISLNTQFVDQSAITASLNGAATAFTFVNGVISLTDFSLIEGSNTVTITFGNDCSSETVTYVIESDQCDTPIITVANPNVVVTDPLYTFTCNVQNITDGNNLQVAINGTTVNSTFANGVLTAQMSLQVGANTVTVTANGCETTSISYTITYELPCNPITFTHVNPVSNDTVYQTATSTMIKINALNVAQSDINVTHNGNPITFTYLSGAITVLTQGLTVGNNAIVIHMTNACSDAEAIFHVVVGEPCVPPTISFGNTPATVNTESITLNATVTGVDAASQIVVSLNGQSIPFTFNAGAITANATLNQGANTINIAAIGCQNAGGSFTITYTPPCDPITFNLIAPATQSESVTDGTYNITLGTQHITNPATVTATLNGANITPSYDGQSGNIDLHNIPLVEGPNTIIVNFSNDCSNKMVEYVVTYTEPAGPCGPRFNPGNSEWQFCLVTPDGTFNRDDLANNAGFNYSGPATAAYFKPIAGGGDAIVNGQPYSVSNGAYYLFEGSLTVDVSSSHPGSMGHWEICIQSDAVPTFGNGNNRPLSPCEGGSNDGGSTDPDFTIEGDGTIHTDDNFCATIKCLGESVVYNNSQDAYVTVEYSVDGGSNYYQFNSNNFVNGGEQLTVQAPTGSDIVLKSICVNQNGNWTNTEISNTGSQYVYVLKNGDQAPNFAPSQGQAGVETFLAGLVDGQGNVTIGPNDVIYLFELRFVGNYGIDYQDCVMLITLDEGSNCPPPSNPTGSGNNHGQVYLAPTFKHISPNGLKSSSTTQSFALKTEIENVNDPSDIELSVNNIKVPAFNYDIATRLLTANLKLKPGANSVKIAAKNGSKTNQVTYDINYEDKSTTVNTTVLKPTITNISPSTTTGAAGTMTYTFKAKVLNVGSKADIGLTINGTTINNFTYSSSTKQVAAVLRLREGANTVKLTAKNGAENVDRTYTLNYKAKTEGSTTTNNLAPTITNLAPTTTTAVAASLTYAFKAKVGNVSSKSSIKLTVNGQAYPNFSYTTSTHQVSAVVRLAEGPNTVKLEASNGGKNIERTYTITYKSKDTGGGTTTTTTDLKPVITSVNPRGGTTSVTSATFMYKAKVSNVSSKSNVQITLNGRPFSSFSFSSASGDVSAVLKMVSGRNTVKVKAVNGSQVTEKTYVITYTPRTTNTGGGTKTTNGGTNTTGGGTKTTNGGTKTTGGGTKTTNGGTKTTGGGTKTTNGGTKTTTGGGTKTTTSGGTKTTTGGGTRTTGGGTKTTTGGGTRTTGGGTRTTGGGI